MVPTAWILHVSREVSGPYAARLTQEDICQISELPFFTSGIRRSVHSICARISAVALYFFFSLVAGGRVGSFNILPWLAILAALAAVVGGSVC